MISFNPADFRASSSIKELIVIKCRGFSPSMKPRQATNSLSIESRGRSIPRIETDSSLGAGGCGFTRGGQGGRRFGRFLQSGGDDFRNTKLFHCDAVKRVGGFHGSLVVADQDKLAVLAK